MFVIYLFPLWRLLSVVWFYFVLLYHLGSCLASNLNGLFVYTRLRCKYTISVGVVSEY